MDQRPAFRGTPEQIFIPHGFAHGFLALTDTVQFLYKCSDFYDPTSEHGILWNDPDLAISWGVAEPLISEKTPRICTLAAMPREFLPLYSREMKPTILLIGTNGQVGRELHKMLPRVGEVTALDRQQLDLTKPDEIRSAIRTCQPAIHRECGSLHRRGQSGIGGACGARDQRRSSRRDGRGSQQKSARP